MELYEVKDHELPPDHIYEEFDFNAVTNAAKGAVYENESFYEEIEEGIIRSVPTLVEPTRQVQNELEHVYEPLGEVSQHQIPGTVAGSAPAVSQGSKWLQNGRVEKCCVCFSQIPCLGKIVIGLFLLAAIIITIAAVVAN